MADDIVFLTTSDIRLVVLSIRVFSIRHEGGVESQEKSVRITERGLGAYVGLPSSSGKLRGFAFPSCIASSTNLNPLPTSNRPLLALPAFSESIPILGQSPTRKGLG